MLLWPIMLGLYTVLPAIRMAVYVKNHKKIDGRAHRKFGGKSGHHRPLIIRALPAPTYSKLSRVSRV